MNASKLSQNFITRLRHQLPYNETTTVFRPVTSYSRWKK